MLHINSLPYNNIFMYNKFVLKDY